MTNSEARKRKEENMRVETRIVPTPPVVKTPTPMQRLVTELQEALTEAKAKCAASMSGPDQIYYQRQGIVTGLRNALQAAQEML